MYDVQYGYMMYSIMYVCTSIMYDIYIYVFHHVYTTIPLLYQYDSATRVKPQEEQRTNLYITQPLFDWH